MPSDVCPPVACSSSSRSPNGAAAGYRQRLERPERERTIALDQQTFIEGAQLTLSLARRPREALRGALGAAERDARKGEPAEQVVPVAVRGQQPTGGREARLLDERREGIELLWEDRRVDHEDLCGRTLPHRRPPRAGRGRSRGRSRS